MEYDIFKLMFISVIISFLGYATENIWLLFTKGYMDNRNTVLPFLSGYGLSVVVFYLLVGTPSETHFDVIYYVQAVITVGIGEILLGTFVEKYIGVVYWNYSWIPLHLTKYTSLPTSLGFAMITMLFMRYCFDPIMDTLALIPRDLLCPASVFLFVLINLDTLHGFMEMRKNHKQYSLWKIELPRSIEDFPVLFH